MTNDLEPIGSSPIGEFFEKLNLPHLIAGPAGKAISRLIGASVDIPAAALERIAKNIRSKTDAKETVTKALAQAAANHAVADPDLVDRATQTLLGKELRRQGNKEAIAKKTLEVLEHAPIEEGAESNEQIDDDWLNMFERYAEEASSERLQDIWSRVLAGEIRKSKTFSLKTLGFISELDERVALKFEQYASKVAWGDFIPMKTMDLKGPVFDDMLELEEFGLTHSHSGSVRYIPITPRGFVITYSFSTTGIFIQTDRDVQIMIPGILLTRVGKEVFTILKPTFEEKNAIELGELIPKEEISKVWLCQKVPTLDQYIKIRPLWEKSGSVANS